MVAFIDVIFLLFTFFSLTMRYQLEGQLPIKTPRWGGWRQQLTVEQKELEVVKILLSRRDNDLMIILQDDLVEDLPTLYRRLVALPPEIPVVIDAQGRVAYKEVIRVYNLCLKAGLQQIAFAVYR